MTFSYGLLLLIDMQVLVDQQGLIYISSVQTLNAFWKTCQDLMNDWDKYQESGNPELSACLNDDDVDDVDDWLDCYYTSPRFSCNHFLHKNLNIYGNKKNNNVEVSVM